MGGFIGSILAGIGEAHHQAQTEEITRHTQAKRDLMTHYFNLSNDENYQMGDREKYAQLGLATATSDITKWLKAGGPPKEIDPKNISMVPPMPPSKGTAPTQARGPSMQVPALPQAPDQIPQSTSTGVGGVQAPAVPSSSGMVNPPSLPGTELQGQQFSVPGTPPVTAEPPAGTFQGMKSWQQRAAESATTEAMKAKAVAEATLPSREDIARLNILGRPGNRQDVTVQIKGQPDPIPATEQLEFDNYGGLQRNYIDSRTGQSIPRNQIEQIYSRPRLPVETPNLKNRITDLVAGGATTGTPKTPEEAKKQQEALAAGALARKDPLLVKLEQARVDVQRANLPYIKARATMEQNVARLNLDPNVIEDNLNMVMSGVVPLTSIEEKGGLRQAVIKYAADSGIALPMPTSAGAQRVMQETSPVLGQVDQLLTAMEPFKDMNEPFQFFRDRLYYALGMKDDKDFVDSGYGDIVAKFEMAKVVGGARILRGSSRALPALELAMAHLPNLWKGSGKLIYGQLQNLRDNLSQIRQDAMKYGNKFGVMPKDTSKTPTPPQTPSGNIFRYDVQGNRIQ